MLIVVQVIQKIVFLCVEWPFLFRLCNRVIYVRVQKILGNVHDAVFILVTIATQDQRFDKNVY